MALGKPRLEVQHLAELDSRRSPLDAFHGWRLRGNRLEQTLSRSHELVLRARAADSEKKKEARQL
jgi:hypothetical protein